MYTHSKTVEGSLKTAHYLRLGTEKLKQLGVQMFSSLDELEWLIGVCWKFGSAALVLELERIVRLTCGEKIDCRKQANIQKEHDLCHRCYRYAYEVTLLLL
jgi:hypothetical protein